MALLPPASSFFFHTSQRFHSARHLAQRAARAYAGFMAQPDCKLCGGTGWKTVERISKEEEPNRVMWHKPVEGVAIPRRVWAVPCDCTGGDRFARLMARTRIPKRYEHCDFSNFDTDV